MYPTLLTFGPIHISAFGVFTALGFITMVFLVWKNLRNHVLVEEKIFDTTIVVAIASIIGARIAFMLLHPQVFELSLLRAFLLWSFPGLNFWGGLFGGVLAIVLSSILFKLELNLVADSFAKAFPFSMFFLSFGIFLDGSVAGKVTKWFTGVTFPGDESMTHPVGIYAAFLSFVYIILIFSILTFMKKEIKRGLFTWLTILFIGLSQLLLTFFRSELLTLQGIPVDMVISGILFVIPVVPLFHLLEGKNEIASVVALIRSLGKKNS